MFKQVASAAILIIVYTTTAIGQPATSIASNTNAREQSEELLAGTEAAKAIERLGDLSRAAVRERLRQMREPAYLPGALLVKKIVELQHLPIAESKRVDNGKSADQGEVEKALASIGYGSAQELKDRLFTFSISILDAESRAQSIKALPTAVRDERITQGKLLRRIEPVFDRALDLHGRIGKVELFVFHHDAPMAQLWRGCVLMLSDSLAEELSEAELAGIITHELAHSYFEDEMAAVQGRPDTVGMRVIELKCDAVAIVSLKLMGHNPGQYLRGLQRIQAINKRQSRSRGFLQSHPELVTRAQFAERFIKKID